MASAEMGTDLHCCETFCLVVVMVFIKVAKAEGEAGGGDVGSIPFVGKNMEHLP